MAPRSGFRTRCVLKARVALKQRQKERGWRAQRSSAYFVFKWMTFFGSVIKTSDRAMDRAWGNKNIFTFCFPITWTWYLSFAARRNFLVQLFCPYQILSSKLPLTKLFFLSLRSVWLKMTNTTKRKRSNTILMFSHYLLFWYHSWKGQRLKKKKLPNV